MTKEEARDGETARSCDANARTVSAASASRRVATVIATIEPGSAFQPVVVAEVLTGAIGGAHTRACPRARWTASSREAKEYERSVYVHRSTWILTFVDADDRIS